MAIVRNLKPQPLDFRTVWRTPTGSKPTGAGVRDTDSYQLRLSGSGEDDEAVDAHNKALEEGQVRQPYNSADVPRWALDRYRGVGEAHGDPAFQNRERVSIISVSTPA